MDYNIEIVRRLVMDAMYANKALEMERDILNDKLEEMQADLDRATSRIAELELAGGLSDDTDTDHQ